MNATAIDSIRHGHGLNTLAGYVVVRTDWSDGADSLTKEDVERFDGAHRYVDALERVRQVRRECSPKQYGIIENVYTCGCRS